MYADSFFASQAYANYVELMQDSNRKFLLTLSQYNEKLTSDDQTQGSEGSTDDR